MQVSSPQIPVMRVPTPLGVTRRKRGEAAMVPGRRRVRNRILDTNSTILLDRDHQLIRRITTTTASLHDSQIDLSEKGGDSLPGQGLFRRETTGIDGQDHAPGRSKSSTVSQGEVQKQSNQQDEIPVGATICRDQNGIPCRLSLGKNLRTSACEMSLLVFFIQPETTADDRTTDCLRGSYLS